MKLAKTFMPISKEDLKNRGISQLDFIIVTGDAYVDHSSFGTAIIGRTLESEGFSVGIIAQPDWSKNDDFKSWMPVILKNQYNGDFMEAPNPSDQAKLEIIHYLVNKIMEKRKAEELDDDLPF